MRSGWSGGVCAVLCVACFCAVLCGTGYGSARSGGQAGGSSGRKTELTAWQQAERGLEELQGIPEGSRTKADYQRAMDGFRAVYHGAPGDVHAPDSVSTVAELLAEQGRVLHDTKSSKAAVGQYEFLRTQYPASSLRVGALLAEASWIFFSRRLLGECRTFVAFAGGRTGAANGAYDDCFMAMALAQSVRGELGQGRRSQAA